jgi:glutamate synthase domain-containing protein 1
LLRVKKLTLQEIAKVISASFWSTIEEKSEQEKAQETFLRKAFPSLLINGPFSIIFGFEGGIMALNDRLKLRSMVCAEKGDLAYVSSEECGIRVIESNPDKIYSPAGGQPIIYTLNEGGRS